MGEWHTTGIDDAIGYRVALPGSVGEGNGSEQRVLPQSEDPQQRGGKQGDAWGVGWEAWAAVDGTGLEVDRRQERDRRQ